MQKRIKVALSVITTVILITAVVEATLYFQYKNDTTQSDYSNVTFMSSTIPYTVSLWYNESPQELAIYFNESNAKSYQLIPTGLMNYTIFSTQYSFGLSHLLGGNFHVSFFSKNLSIAGAVYQTDFTLSYGHSSNVYIKSITIKVDFANTLTQ